MPVKRVPPPRGYITASQAMRRLGDISRGMLRWYAVKGEIEHVVPESKSHGYYSAASVDRLAATLSIPDRRARFKDGTLEDLPEVATLLEKVFGGATDETGRVIPNNPIERRAGWVRANPECLYIVRAGSELVGCAFVLPLSEGKIRAILDSESTPPIYGYDIQPYRAGIPTSLYIMSACVYAKDHNIVTKRGYGARLIAGLMSRIVGLGARGIILQSIYAKSEASEGINLLKGAGFTEIESRTHYRDFKIYVPESGLPEIMRYKRAVKLKE